MGSQDRQQDLQEPVLEAEAFPPTFAGRRRHRNRPGRSPQGKEGRRSQAARHRTPPGQRPLRPERLPPSPGEPAVPAGHQTKVDVSGVKVPDHINDAYFKRAAAAKKAAAASGKKEGDIFESKKEEYKPSEQRKTDQVAVDKQLLEAVKK